jgi:phosphohistidine swiveling domain-containing protein
MVPPRSPAAPARALAPAPAPAAPRAGWVLPLEAIDPADVASAGGKAAGLAALVRGGFPVPEAIVITTAATRAVLVAAGLAGAFAALARRAAAPPLADEARWLAEVRTRIGAAPVPPELRAALLAAAAPLLAGGPVAVRSSGAAEDAEDASFAGQYGTVLGVGTPEALVDAVLQCVASAFAPGLLAYLRSRDPARAGLAMAVVVQRQVPARASGVLFTLDPLTGREDVVVESGPGLGDARVAGRAGADRDVVERLPWPRVTSRRPCGAAPVLGEDGLLALAELGGRVQEHLGRPVDVEWVLGDEGFALVQARAITHVALDPAAGEWTTANFREGGVSAGPCTPFLWSLYDRAFGETMPAYLRGLGLLPRGHAATWARLFFARPYWNVGEVKRAMARLPGFVERSFDADLGIAPAYDGPGRTTPVTPGTLLRGVPVALRLAAGLVRRGRARRRLARALAPALRPFDVGAATLDRLPARLLAARYRALVERLFFPVERAYFLSVYDASNGRLVFEAVRRRAERVSGALDASALLGGLLDVSHLRPQQDLHETAGRLARSGDPVDDATVRAFADRWPHRGRRELDVRVPRWPDDLPFVRALLEDAREGWRREDDPAALAHARHAAYRSERARALGSLRRRPLDALLLRGAIALVRDVAWWREELRDRSNRVHAVLRRWTLGAARRLAGSGALAAEEDVWALRLEDVCAALDGTLAPGEVRRRARAGSRTLQAFRTFRAPGELGARAAVAQPARESLAAVRGVGCSRGVVIGRARVVRDLADAGRVRAGEILVAPWVDPGWTPLLARVAGVVAESGGLLSHAAVIARELGIPAVLGAPSATAVLRDGALVRLDGGDGSAALVEAEAP